MDILGNPQHNFATLGLYYLQDEVMDNRPVYRHENGQYFLHFVASTGTWMVGPVAGAATGSLFVQDHAWRPEHITNMWVIFTGHAWNQGEGIRVQCS